MKKVTGTIRLFGILISCFMLLTAFRPSEQPKDIISTIQLQDTDNELKQKVLGILKAKCNVCHKKQNPFKIFNLRNMDKHAPKIFKQVFVYQRMPKGDKIKLTDQESKTLKKWLEQQKKITAINNPYQ